MKRTFRWTAVLLSLALLLPLSAAWAAETQTIAALWLDSNRMAVGSSTQQVDPDNPQVVPFARNQRTLVPVSRIVAAFGGRSGWEQATSTATFALNGHTVRVQIGSTLIDVDGKTQTMDVPALAMNDRTYVPLRAVLEGLGLTVEYEPTWRIIIVSDAPVDKEELLVLPPAVALVMEAVWQEQPPSQPGEIAGAVSGSVGSFDTSSLSSVIVPELGAASGYRLSSKEDPNVDGVEEYVYNMEDIDFTKATEETVQATREYFDLLASLPYFEVVEEINKRGSFYSGGLRYTGTSPAVKKNTVTTFNGKVPCDVGFWLDTDGHSVFFKYAPGLKVVDTGDRISLGKGYTDPTLTGPRAKEAFCYDNGTYYNASDRALSVKSGGVSLLVNGVPCTGTVDFRIEDSDKSWAVDKFTVSGFQRSQWIEFAFPMNYGQTGDFYTAADFRRWSEYPYDTTNKGALWAFAVSANNGNDFVMPMANMENPYEAVNVRVVKWDKTGDTVVYFYAKLTLDGSPYEVEGLLAAPNRVEEARPSGGSGGDGECWYCGGSGVCPTCGGSGKVSNWMPGTEHTFLEQNCTDCYRDGKCRMCGGSGRG